MDIVFIGVGYVGLISGVMMSYLGHNVTCIEIDVFKIEQLQAGILPIYEPGLEEYFRTELQSGKLKFLYSLFRARKSRGYLYHSRHSVAGIRCCRYKRCLGCYSQYSK